MKKFFAAAVGVLSIIACSDATAPSADLAARYDKPVPPPPPAPTSPYTVDDSYNFNSVSVSGAGSSFGTEPKPGSIGASAATVTQAPSGERFLGRFEDVNTNALLNVANGGAHYSLTFDLYIIGSWDGKGKQAQQGMFLANVFSVAYRCSGTGAGTAIFSSTFSNQLTVQQDYPANTALGESGGNKAGTGAFAVNALDYASHPELSNTPRFRSFGDTEYRLSWTGTNPCGAGNAVTFIFSTLNPAQQGVWDESWGIDNVHIIAGA
jgi:hypothetical protein